jgi:hypothetical protein
VRDSTPNLLIWILRSRFLWILPTVVPGYSTSDAQPDPIHWTAIDIGKLSTTSPGW